MPSTAASGWTWGETWQKNTKYVIRISYLVGFFVTSFGVHANWTWPVSLMFWNRVVLAVVFPRTTAQLAVIIREPRANCKHQSAPHLDLTLFPSRKIRKLLQSEVRLPGVNCSCTLLLIISFLKISVHILISFRSSPWVWLRFNKNSLSFLCQNYVEKLFLAKVLKLMGIVCVWHP